MLTRIRIVVAATFVLCAGGASAQSCAENIKPDAQAFSAMVDCLREISAENASLRTELQEIKAANNGFVYLGEVRSCTEKNIPVPNLGRTTTDDWFVISSPVKLTAQFGTGVMTNNALYSVSIDVNPNNDKSSWRAYLSLQVNAATEQKREPIDYCKGPNNRDNSIVDLYAIRRH